MSERLCETLPIEVHILKCQRDFKTNALHCYDCVDRMTNTIFLILSIDEQSYHYTNSYRYIMLMLCYSLFIEYNSSPIALKNQEGNVIKKKLRVHWKASLQNCYV